MPQVSRFFKLPADVQAEIEARLAANGFSDYTALVEELQRRGYRISRSALHRRGRELKRDLAAAPAARHALARLR